MGYFYALCCICSITLKPLPRLTRLGDGANKKAKVGQMKGTRRGKMRREWVRKGKCVCGGLLSHLHEG